MKLRSPLLTIASFLALVLSCGAPAELDAVPDPAPAAASAAVSVAAPEATPVEPPALPGAPKPRCDDGNSCTKDKVLKDGTCEHTPLTGRCDDGNPCTTGDACAQLANGSAVCRGDFLPAGASCDNDADFCTGAGSCNANHVCVFRDPPSVDDGNACTIDQCHPKTGKITHDPAPPGTPCPDDDLCNGSETCDAGGHCLAGPPPDIDDGYACTIETCDPATGLVVSEPAPAGTSCDDGKPCTGPDTCDGAGVCLGAKKAAGTFCTPGNPCSTCSAAGSCDPMPAGAPCGDGDTCNGAETCNGSGSCDSPLDGALDGTACTLGPLCLGICSSGTCIVENNPCNDGDECTGDAESHLDKCDAAGNCIGAPLTGTACDAEGACAGGGTCNAGTCTSRVVSIDDGNDKTLDACFPDVGIIHADCDPAHLDLTVSTSLAMQVECLYVDRDPSSSVVDPIQRDVDCNPLTLGVIEPCVEPFDPMGPGPFHPARVAVARGTVLDEAGFPLVGARVEILGHPEWGHTVSRPAGIDDGGGQYDLVVEGGGDLTVRITKPGFLEAQRLVHTRWNQVTRADDAVLIARSPIANPILDGGSSADGQTALGQAIGDLRGNRQGVLWFPQNVLGTVEYSDGSAYALSTFGNPAVTVRITEYTEGELGVERMPANLPPSSMFTYAVELSVDQVEDAKQAAQSIGQPFPTKVSWSEPLAYFVEDFIGVGPGVIVPLGFYDREAGRWKGLPNGRSIKVESVDASGKATVSGTEPIESPDPIVIPDGALREIGSRYAPGQVIWYVPIPHFTPHDMNYPWGPPGGACSWLDCISQALRPGGRMVDENACLPGSIIEAESRVLSESMPLNGTAFSLNYSSAQQPGRDDNRTVEVNLGNCNTIGVEPAVRVRGTLSIAGFEDFKLVECVEMCGGNPETCHFEPLGDQIWKPVWDGKDAFGNVVLGEKVGHVTVEYGYNNIQYKNPEALEQAWAQASDNGASASLSGKFTYIAQSMDVVMGATDLRPLGLGGWRIGQHHSYDPVRKTLFLGDGSRISGAGITAALEKIYDNTNLSNDFGGLVVGPDGALYFSETNVHRVLRLDRETGALTVVAGTFAQSGSSGDGGSPQQAKLSSPKGLSFCPDGSLLIADYNNHRVRRISPDGAKIETVDGSVVPSFVRSVACGVDGAIYVGTSGVGAPIHRIADGVRAPFVWPDPSSCSNCTSVCGIPIAGDPAGPISRAAISPGSEPLVLAAPDGSLYVSSSQCVARIDPSGNAVRVAGSSGAFWADDGEVATSGRLYETGTAPDIPIALDPMGRLLFAQMTPELIATSSNAWAVRRVETDGRLTTLAGRKQATLGQAACSLSEGTAGYGGVAPGACLGLVAAVGIGPDFETFFQVQRHSIVRVRDTLPGLGLGEIAVPDPTGAAVFVFDAYGKHLRTEDAYLFGAPGAVPLLTFGYSNNLLTSITDADGQITTIERFYGQGDTYPSSVVIKGPFDQQTNLFLDENGYLASAQVEVTPAHLATTYFTYDPPDSGLLKTKTTPLNFVHEYEFDEHGRLIKDKDPEDGFQHLISTDDQGDSWTLKAKTAEGRETTFQVFGANTKEEKKKRTLPWGGVVTVENAGTGEPITTYPDGTVSSMTLASDPMWGMLAPQGTVHTQIAPGWTFDRANERALTFNAQNELKGVLDTTTGIATKQGLAQTRVETNHLDLGAKTWTHTSSGGRVGQSVLDDHGRVAMEIPDCPPGYENGVDKWCPLPTSYTYNGAGQLETVVQEHRITTYVYFGSVGAEAPYAGMLKEVVDSSLVEIPVGCPGGTGVGGTSADGGAGGAGGAPVVGGAGGYGGAECPVPPAEWRVSYERDLVGRVRKARLPLDGVDTRDFQFEYDDDGRLTGVTPPREGRARLSVR